MKYLSSLARPRLMNVVIVLALLLAALPAPQPVQALSTGVVISQVYGGGGNSGAPYNADFVELFNRGTTPVSLAGWSIQYTSAAGTGNFGANTGQQTDIPSVTLQPGQYYLVQEGSGTTGAALPTPDLTDSTPINLSGTAGKVALVNTTTPLGCNGSSTPCSAAALAQIVDLVGYGSTANFFEGTGPAPAPSNTLADIRGGNGCVETDNNSTDFVTGAPAPRNTSSPTSPCVGDAAPTVTATTPANNAADVALDASLTLTFSEPVTLADGAAAVSCTVSGAHTTTASGDGTTFTLVPSPAFAPGETCTVTVAAAGVSDQDAIDPPDNLAADYTFSFTTLTPDACTLAYTPIYTVQGSGAATPINGQQVAIQGVVTGDFQGAGTVGLGGFFMQDLTGDGNPATSDGIFVFQAAANPLSAVDVAVGDVVRVEGKPKEFNGLTEMDNLTALKLCGTTAPVTPTVVTLPETVNGELEQYEGMLVTIPQTLTVDQNFFQGRYGQVTLSEGGRLANPTNLYPAGSPEAQALTAENARRLVVLDDGKSGQNPNPIPYIGADNTLRAGDVVNGVTGNLDFGPINSDTSLRDYRIQPTAPVSITRVNERTAAPEPVGGNVKVASFNVLNYFTSLGTADANRGANNPAEFARQKAKIVAAITAINADVLGLIEIENNGTTAIGNLVDALNAATAPGTYAFVADPATGVGTDAIKVALIYQPGRVTPVGPALSSPDPIFDRFPVAQTFALNTTGAKVSVIINHFKSKGSCPAAGDPNADQGDGQGCWNQKRLGQAAALLTFIEQVKTSAGDPDVLVLGDLNSYGKEDPVLALEAGGLIDEIASHVAFPYSYVFDGLAGYLDHGLASASLDAQVSGVTEWHINADEPSVIDYNTEFKPQDLYTPTPYRSSDHDPVIVGLNLNAPPTVSAGGPYSVVEGGTVTLTASGTDPDGGALTYAWDLDNNGTFETPGQSVTFSAAGIEAPATRTVAVQVTDAGGLTAQSSTTVVVIYAFSGFFSPIANPPAVNNVNAGQAVPIKFSLGGNQGLNILAAGSPQSQQVSCTTGAPVGPLQTITTNGGLTYDAQTGQYSLVWKTDKAWARTCRVLTLTLVDGTTHTATFNFTK